MEARWRASTAAIGTAHEKSADLSVDAFALAAGYSPFSAAIPPFAEAIHEGAGSIDPFRLALLLARFVRRVLHRCGGENHATEHRGEADHAQHDAQHHVRLPHGDTRDDGAEADDRDDDSCDEIAVAERPPARRVHDVGVVLHEMTLHLVQQTLLLFGEWHWVPSRVFNARVYRP